MKFYDYKPAPSPRRVRMFLAEKGLEIPTEQVDLRNKEQLGDAFRAINPRCTVPVLVLDDGTAIADIDAICRYIEERHPEPPLLGRTPEERAAVTALNNQIEFDGVRAIADSFRNSVSGFKGRALPGPHDMAQIPELAERSRLRAGLWIDAMNERLADSEFVAGDAFSVCDITTFVAIEFAGWQKITIPDSHTHFARWHQAVAARPSAQA